VKVKLQARFCVNQRSSRVDPKIDHVESVRVHLTVAHL
jgi:hypothetical protein